MLEDISDTVHEIDEQLDEVIEWQDDHQKHHDRPGQNPPLITPRKTCCGPPFRARELSIPSSQGGCGEILADYHEPSAR